MTDDSIEQVLEEVFGQPDLESLPVGTAVIRREVLERGDEIRRSLLTYQSGVGTAGRALRSAQLQVHITKRRILYVVSAVLLLDFVLATLSLQSIVGLDWPMEPIDFKGWFWKGSSGLGGAWLGLGLAFVLGVLLVAFPSFFMRNSRVNAQLRERERELDGADARLAEALLRDARGMVLEIVNRWESDEVATGAFIKAVDAKDLVELEMPATITAHSLDAADEFVKHYETSAIGIAGPRGIGKSTIMIHLATSDRSSGRTGVYLPAPVRYDAPDFVRHIHAKVAQSVLDDFGVSEEQLDRRPSAAANMATFRMALAILLVVAGLIMFFGIDAPPFGLDPLVAAIKLLGVTTVTVGAIGLAYAVMHTVNRSRGRRGFRPRGYIPLLRPRSRSRRDDQIVALALDELRSLRWQTSVQVKNKLDTKLVPSTKFEQEDQVSLAQRDRSHPERVADFKDFLSRYHKLAGKDHKLVIGIDELDKIASADEAIAMVNALKDLFRISNTHFFVSVSEDALDSFALRGVPVRDTFDSSFDTVLRVLPFTAEDSRHLLSRRVRGFPDAAALLCHAIAGGLPRDLIRAARRSVNFRREQENPLPVAALAERLTRAEALDAIEAAVRRSRGTDHRHEYLFAVRRFLDESTESMHTGIVPLAQAWISQSSPAELREPLVVLLLQLATAAEFFGTPRDSAQWESTMASIWFQEGIRQLTQARAVLALSHMDAMQRLETAREHLGLEKLPPFPDHLTGRNTPTD
ncbi:P-loop NTPase fold protein [Rhizocola hellebori]|uniref:P-loop NTPase fold protein n=1 Tax=Rhizocola hellebori TaxID=1392758 RepID=UPI001943AED6|nr:P-loop NTPase fold protein [Rhizocola hellebori]